MSNKKIQRKEASQTLDEFSTEIKAINICMNEIKTELTAKNALLQEIYEVITTMGPKLEILELFMLIIIMFLNLFLLRYILREIKKMKIEKGLKNI